MEKFKNIHTFSAMLWAGEKLTESERGLWKLVINNNNNYNIVINNNYFQIAFEKKISLKNVLKTKTNVFFILV